MLKVFFQRLIHIIPTIVIVTLIVGTIIHLIPGDPTDIMLGDFATEEEKFELKEALGLDKPIISQLGMFYLNLLRGDLGVSLLENEPVTDLILQRLPYTLALTIGGILVAILMSIPLGIISALHAGKAVDHIALLFALLGVAIPNFWLGPLLIILFSLQLSLLPVSGIESGLASYVLPSLTLGTSLAAILTRMSRNTILDLKGDEFVRTANAKGLHSMQVLIKHILRNASLPLITIIGLQIGALMTGAVITEKIFDIPGIGSLMLEALSSRDYPLVQGCVLIFSVSYVLINLATDILVTWVDPRIRGESI